MPLLPCFFSVVGGALIVSVLEELSTWAELVDTVALKSRIKLAVMGAGSSSTMFGSVIAAAEV